MTLSRCCVRQFLEKYWPKSEFPVFIKVRVVRKHEVATVQNKVPNDLLMKWRLAILICALFPHAVEMSTLVYWETGLENLFLHATIFQNSISHSTEYSL